MTRPPGAPSGTPSSTSPCVLLLQAPLTLKPEDVSTFGLFPPLGLAYLAATLEKSGIPVCIADLLAEGVNRQTHLPNGNIRIGLTDEEIRARLRSLQPLVVGITHNFTSFAEDCLRLARLVREILPETLIVMGGAAAVADIDGLLSERQRRNGHNSGVSRRARGC